MRSSEQRSRLKEVIWFEQDTTTHFLSKKQFFTSFSWQSPLSCVKVKDQRFRFKFSNLSVTLYWKIFHKSCWTLSNMNSIKPSKLNTFSRYFRYCRPAECAQFHYESNHILYEQIVSSNIISKLFWNVNNRAYGLREWNSSLLMQIESDWQLRTRSVLIGLHKRCVRGWIEQSRFKTWIN